MAATPIGAPVVSLIIGDPSALQDVENQHFFSSLGEDGLDQLKTSAEDLADRIRVYIQERHCFQTFGFFCNIRKFYSLMTSLQKKGVKFCFAPGFQSLHIRTPLHEMQKIPWPILHLFCRFDGLMCRALTDPKLAITKDLVLQCLQVKERYRKHTDSVDIILDCLRFLELGIHWTGFISALIAPLQFWKQGGNISSLSSDLAIEAVYAQEAFERMSEVLNRQKASIVHLDAESDFMDESPLIQLTKKIFFVQANFSKKIEELFHKFNAESLPQLASQYVRVYSEADALARGEKLSLSQFVEQKKHFSPAIVFEFPNQRRYPQSIQEAFSGFSALQILTPDEFIKPLEEKGFDSFVDKYIQEYVTPRAMKNRSSVSYIDFLPAHLVQQAKIQEEIRQAQATKKKAKKDAAPVEKKVSESQKPLQESESGPGSSFVKPESLLPKTPSPKLEPPVETSAAASEMVLEGASSSSAPPAASSPLYGIAVRVGDGPNVERTYTDHAGRWAVRGLDVFSDPEYRQQKLSKEYKENILLYHSFGRALVEVVITLGKHFVKKKTGGFICESFTLPGEIIKPDGGYEKVVFTVSLDGRSKSVIHMYATRKTPVMLVQEYAKDGFFAADEDEILKMLQGRGSQVSKKSYTLPDDESRVTEVSDEFVSVVQKDGVVLNVYPFPDLI